MAESFIVRRGGSGGGISGIAVYTGDSLPTDKEYGIWCNVGDRDVNGIIVDYVVSDQYNVQTILNNSYMHGIGFNNEETTGLYIQNGSRNVCKYDLSSNTTSVLSAIELNDSYWACCQYIDNNVWYISGNDMSKSVIDLYKYELDTSISTLVSQYGIRGRCLLMNRASEQIVQGLYANNSPYAPTVLNWDISSHTVSVFWSGDSAYINVHPWCNIYGSDGDWYLVNRNSQQTGGYRRTLYLSNTGAMRVTGFSSISGIPIAIFCRDNKLFYITGDTIVYANISSDYTLSGSNIVYTGTISIAPWKVTGHVYNSPTSAWWVSTTALQRFTFSSTAYPDGYVVIKVNNSGSSTMATIVSTEDEQVNIPVESILYQDNGTLISIGGSVRELNGEWVSIS